MAKTTTKPAAAKPTTAAAAKPAKATKAAAPATTEKQAKAEAAKVERDALGNRKGTECSKINAVLTATPQTPAQIAEASGAAISLVRAHLATLRGKELVQHTDEGWCLAGAKPATKAKGTKAAAKA